MANLPVSVVLPYWWAAGFARVVYRTWQKLDDDMTDTVDPLFMFPEASLLWGMIWAMLLGPFLWIPMRKS